jgi:ribosomal protein L37AE/L43A
MISQQLHYGVRMSVLYRETDYAPGETFRHPTHPCTVCERLVIGSSGTGPIVCEECLRMITSRRNEARRNEN